MDVNVQLTTEPIWLGQLRTQGYALLNPAQWLTQTGIRHEEWLTWQPHWQDLPLDTYLKDGGKYRRRRHSCFVVDGERVVLQTQRPHWQPVDYNALHGGMNRWFEPIPDGLAGASSWLSLLRWLGRMTSGLKGQQPWFVEAHQFRIDTTGGIGRPTPEGAHRDGVDLVAVLLLDRCGIKGGETRVFDAQGHQGWRFTLEEPGSLLLLDDERVIHETTPIQPVLADAHRDTLVITLRAGNFQAESA